MIPVTRQKAGTSANKPSPGGMNFPSGTESEDLTVTLGRASFVRLSHACWAVAGMAASAAPARIRKRRSRMGFILSRQVHLAQHDRETGRGMQGIEARKGLKEDDHRVALLDGSLHPFKGCVRLSQLGMDLGEATRGHIAPPGH